MLIATLPTLTGTQAEKLAEEVIKHPGIDGVRYNTGGDSPYAPKHILEIIKPLIDRYQKAFYVDLEGRQMRVAHWTPQSRGVVTLNRDFDIELPGKIHFRRAGWFEIISALPEEKKIFFKPVRTKEEYYFGESQSVHVIAKNFEVRGYLGGLDYEYIQESVNLGIANFMLSFVEEWADVMEFEETYQACGRGRDLPKSNLVLKIESQKGIELVEKNSKRTLAEFQLMAARDDLFLGFVQKRNRILDALKLIVAKNPRAILASKIMMGLLEYPHELTLGDMTDIKLMSQFGYKHFMLADELTDCFEEAMKNWQEIVLPVLGKKPLWRKRLWTK